MTNVKNRPELIANSTGENKKAREALLSILEAAIEAADARSSVFSALSFERESRLLRIEGLELRPKGRVFVIGGGKASGRMSEAIDSILGGEIASGAVNVLTGTEDWFKTGKIQPLPAGHPIPDEGSISGTRRMLGILRGVRDGDLVIALISGGGSALLESPLPGITLDDLNVATRVLLECGARIQEINTVRKHLSEIKGGRLARACGRATVISLIISDVIGDPLDSIASGPTAPDTTTFEDAWDVLEKYNIVEEMPESIVMTIGRGVKGAIEESPKPGDPIFERVHNFVISSNEKALSAASGRAESMGFQVITLGSYVEGEARHVGSMMAGIGLGMKHQSLPVDPPSMALAGGETTVRVTGEGMGGRNQELVLGAVERICGEGGVAIASIGTDGVDGTTDAAGAIADSKTLERAEERGMKPSSYLKRNDSYGFFSRLEDLIFTGPTLTNVNDVMAVAVVD